MAGWFEETVPAVAVACSKASHELSDSHVSKVVRPQTDDFVQVVKPFILHHPYLE